MFLSALLNQGLKLQKNVRNTITNKIIYKVWGNMHMYGSHTPSYGSYLLKTCISCLTKRQPGRAPWRANDFQGASDFFTILGEEFPNLHPTRPPHALNWARDRASWAGCICQSALSRKAKCSDMNENFGWVTTEAHVQAAVMNAGNHHQDLVRVKMSFPPPLHFTYYNVL